jgi:hypothetical protein
VPATSCTYEMKTMYRPRFYRNYLDQVNLNEPRGQEKNLVGDHNFVFFLMAYKVKSFGIMEGQSAFEKQKNLSFV